MAATAPPALAHATICTKIATPPSESIISCTVAAICASYNHAGLKGATDGSDRACCSCSWSHLCQEGHCVLVNVPLHGCRNLCILQPCWFEGCNKWQRPRLLLLPMEPSAPKRPQRPANVLLHGCRNLCIVQPCWFEGCNRWQRPRLLLLLMEPSAQR